MPGRSRQGTANVVKREPVPIDLQKSREFCDNNVFYIS